MSTLRLLILLGACSALSFSAQSQQPLSDAQPCDLCGTDNLEWVEEIIIEGLSSNFVDPPGGSVGGCTGLYVIDAYIGYLKKGAYHSFSLTPGYSGALQSEYWKIWVDLNADGDFDDPGDLVYASGSGSTTTVSDSFLIPLSATTGQSAIRVAMRRGSPPPDCGNYTNGQVLDYYPVYIDECDISFTDACAREYIQHVAINTISNASGCGASGYQDFTNISTAMDAGSDYAVELTPGFFGPVQHPERWLIWIDFNMDYDFDDAGEQVFDSGPVGSSSTTFGTISVLAALPSGSTRMRIKMIPTDVNTVTLNPCDPLPSPWQFDLPDQYGEAEDYTVNIQGTVFDIASGGSLDQLVREVFIGGDCFDISNVTFSGNGGQIGTFSNGLASIGFDKGMMLATGDISVTVGPNDQDGASAGFGNATPDADLTQLSGSSANFDLASIEFDFTPSQSPLTFEYVFASEEYCEYVGSQFNDVFGFFISGPGINGPFDGAANIATLGDGSYVTINNVNHISNSGLYNNNTPSTGILCGQTPSVLPSVNELQFDGYTKKLTATASVIPCQTYHIKLKICDIGDGIYDSAVFLKAGSFNGGSDGGTATVDWLVNGAPGTTEAYEGCGTVQLLIHRVGGNINEAQPVTLIILGTATNGVDYTGVPLSVEIPANQSQVLVPVNITSDMIPEGQESIIIKLVNACSCLAQEVPLLINDLPPLEALADTVAICGPGTATVGVAPISGVGPFTYNWSLPNNYNAQVSPFVSLSTNYHVTINDACGRTIVRTARVNVTPLPTGQLLPPAPQICPGGNVLLSVDFNGSGPFAIKYTFNGIQQPPITNILDDPFAFSVNQPGLYQITSVSDGNGCQGPGSDALLVTESVLNLTGVVTNVNCSGQINTTVLGGQGPYNYAWAGPQNIPANTQDPTGLQAGVYIVTVTDGFGCTDVQSFTVNTPPAIVLNIASIQGVNCTNPTGGSINLEVNGGTPGYTYLWSNGATQQDPSGLTSGTYTVTVTDANGCTKTATATVVPDFLSPSAYAGENGTLTCTLTTLTLDGSGSSSGPDFAFQWTASNGGNITSGANGPYPMVNQAGTYTLVVTSTTNGCTASDVVQVNIDITPPFAAAGPNQTLTCAVTNVTLNGSASQGPNFIYQWTTSNGGNITNGVTTLSPTVNQPGTYTLVVTNTTNGCTASISVQVIVNNTPPVANAGSNQTLNCNVATITLNGSGSQGPNFTYQWTASNGGNITSGANTLSPTVNQPGTYILVVANTTNGCTVSDMVSVTGNPNPLSLTAITSGNTITALASGGVGPLQYSIDGVNFQYGNQFFNVPNGTYTVTVKDTNDCTATYQVIVNALLIEIQILPILCFGDNAVIVVIASGGSQPYEYRLNSGLFQNSPVFSGISAGVYSVSVRDANGDIVTLGPITIEEPSLLGVVATVDGDTITATASGGTLPYTYSLNGGSPQTGDIFSDLTSGIYTVVATDSNGCTASVTNLVVTGTVELANAWGLTISPNPSARLFTLTLKNAPEALRAEVSDMTGRLLQSLHLQPVDGQLTTTLDLLDFPPGTYILRLTDGKNWGGVRLSKVGGN